MRILTISDVESPFLWDHFKKERVKDVDLIISCGDLHPHYLMFLETMTNVPLLYVHGNHDGKYADVPPEGCFSIEDEIYVHNGVRILGLGGSMRYNPGPHQYTDRQMKRRIQRLWFKLRRSRGFDILVTHAPLAGFHDGADLCHRGFAAFRPLLEKYNPQYFLHGHMHMDYGEKTPRLCQFGETTVINTFTSYEFEYGDPAVRMEAEKCS